MREKTYDFVYKTDKLIMTLKAHNISNIHFKGIYVNTLGVSKSTVV